jgi:hypothetical protein
MMNKEQGKGNTKMFDRDAAIEIVRNYARDIASHGVHLRTVILYGSFAKGTQHEWLKCALFVCYGYGRC